MFYNIKCIEWSHTHFKYQSSQCFGTKPNLTRMEVNLLLTTNRNTVYRCVQEPNASCLLRYRRLKCVCLSVYLRCHLRHC